MGNFKVSAIYILIFSILTFSSAFPEGRGKWTFALNDTFGYAAMSKSLFKDAQVFIQVTCEPRMGGPPPIVTIQWNLTESRCWEDFAPYMDGIVDEFPIFGATGPSLNSKPVQCKCGEHCTLDETKPVLPSSTNSPEKKGFSSDSSQSVLPVDTDDKVANKKRNPVYTTETDGMYLLTFQIVKVNDKSAGFSAVVDIEMASSYGYLSAAAFPLLPFYGVMCLIYVLLGVAWLVVSFCQWRDLLRIQFWIGGVILLGMLEKAVFYAEFQSINSTGVSVPGAVLSAEIVSCAKRSLARMLVIIVSLGFGIVKPRLGAMLHRVVSSGVLFFVLASVESYKRIMGSSLRSNDVLLASVPLAFLDSIICWWIFSNLVQTMRTLRLRRNMVKLSLYKHFSNTLYFSVVASVCFMLYSIKYHRFAECLTDWKELWVDEAYWHILFSIILLVIMILWRPTNNNQRYAFTPLLDNPEDEDDEEEQFVSDAFGLKMRGNNSNTPPKPKSSTTAEDDLKWVEENIPASLNDTALPILDSDEEVMNTKFEVSKMQ